MGATTWHHYTPHVPDPEVALQILRFQVFAQGAYLDPPTLQSSTFAVGLKRQV